MSLIEGGISHNERSGNVLIVTGVSGAGKTHALRIARENGFIPPEVKGIEMGNKLADYLRGSGIPLETKDEIKSLPPEIVNTGIKDLVTKTLTEVEVPSIVVCHFVYAQGEGEDEELVNMDEHYKKYGDKIGGIMPVFGYPEEIVARREQGSRNRATVTTEAIFRHQEKLFTAAMKVGDYLGVEVRPVMGTKKQDGPTLNQFSEAIRDLVRQIK